MRVQFIRAHGPYSLDQIVDMPDQQANEFIHRGFVEMAPAEVEVAAVAGSDEPSKPKLVKKPRR